jgi:GDPmannose 4,6-dehydratase
MRALITGIAGQDGAYLARNLIEKGYEVFGFYRRASSPNTWRLSALNVLNDIQLICGDSTDMASVMKAITLSKPDEIYNLAAQSFVGTSFEQPLVTAAVDGIGVTMLLEAIQQINPAIKFYQASTSELFGSYSQADPLNEQSPFWPSSPYASAKLYGYHQVRIYREAYGLFAVNGILFNHESPFRGLEFVTRKITNSCARIKLGLQTHLYLGNLEAKRDWGFAPEYVEAMWMMLQQIKPADFVIATGESHSVREFVEIAFAHLNLNWENFVRNDAKHERPLDIPCLLGDPSLAEKKLNWTPKVTFEKLVKIMVDADLKRWQNHIEGKSFHWDAINDPSIIHMEKNENSV